MLKVLPVGPLHARLTRSGSEAASTLAGGVRPMAAAGPILKATAVWNGIEAGQVMTSASDSCDQVSGAEEPSRLTSSMGPASRPAAVPSEVMRSCVPGAGTVMQ